MGDLSKFAAKSPIMNIRIQYKKEIFEFNLDDEMRIDEGRINTNLKSHVRSHAFLNVLLVKLNIKMKNDARVLKRAQDTQMVNYRGKFKTVTEAEAHMFANNPKLAKMQDDLLELEEFRDLIQACVKSFESRKDLLQSLSANTRKETNN